MNYKTVLFIDDDLDEHFFIQEALLSQGTDFPIFNFYTSASKALEDLKVQTLKPDLIISDINIPGLDGIHFLMEIKKDSKLKDIPVIMHSTTQSYHTKQLCENIGSAAFITKDAKFELLFNIITIILAEQVLQDVMYSKYVY